MKYYKIKGNDLKNNLNRSDNTALNEFFKKSQSAQEEIKALLKMDFDRTHMTFRDLINKSDTKKPNDVAKAIQNDISTEFINNSSYNQGQINGALYKLVFSMNIYSPLSLLNNEEHQTFVSNLDEDGVNNFKNSALLQAAPYKIETGNFQTFTVFCDKNSDKFAIWVVSNPFKAIDDREIQVLTNLDNDLFAEKFLPGLKEIEKQEISASDFNKKLYNIINNKELFYDFTDNVARGRNKLQYANSLRITLENNSKKQNAVYFSSGAAIISLTMSMVSCVLSSGSVLGLILSAVSMMLFLLLSVCAYAIYNSVNAEDPLIKDRCYSR